LCVCLLVRVLLASIMYLDNAAASLYQQLTGIPMHTEEDRERREEGETHEAAKNGEMRKGNVSDIIMEDNGVGVET